MTTTPPKSTPKPTAPAAATTTTPPIPLAPPLQFLRQDEHFAALIAALAPRTRRIYAVGGWVRDYLLGLDAAAAPDIDIEVYGLGAGEFDALMTRLGANGVGKSFFVYKLGRFDVALGRVESCTGRGHRAFEVALAADEKSGAARRDFTINALMMDVFSGRVVDFFGGLGDLRRRVLRVVSAASFCDDSLRVLRAAQFVARFGLRVDAASLALMRRVDVGDLSRERVAREFEKLFAAADVARGVRLLGELGLDERYFGVRLGVGAEICAGAEGCGAEICGENAGGAASENGAGGENCAASADFGENFGEKTSAAAGANSNLGGASGAGGAGAKCAAQTAGANSNLDEIAAAGAAFLREFENHAHFVKDARLFLYDLVHFYGLDAREVLGRMGLGKFWARVEKEPFLAEDLTRNYAPNSNLPRPCERGNAVHGNTLAPNFKPNTPPNSIPPAAPNPAPNSNLADLPPAAHSAHPAQSAHPAHPAQSAHSAAHQTPPEATRETMRQLCQIALKMPLKEWLGLNSPKRIALANRLGLYGTPLRLDIDTRAIAAHFSGAQIAEQIRRKQLALIDDYVKKIV